MVETVYTVEISGIDWFEDPDTGNGYWGEEHYVCETFEFDTYEEAKGFVLDMTEEQVIAYEKNEHCNSLDVCIYKRIAISEYGEEWNLEGDAAWIGNNKVEECL